MAVKCPDCGTFNQTHASSCKKCGADLNPKTSPPLAEIAKQASVPWYKRMWRRGNPPASKM